MRVRKGAVYRFHASAWDCYDPPYGVKTGLITNGDLVRVIHPHGCPAPNTMGHAHIETLAGEFAGLVACGSLSKVLT